MMAQTRVHRLLQGYRDRPPAALGEVAACLIRLSQLVIDIAEVSEVDINPLLADSQGVIALDARIRPDATHHGVGSGRDRLAIRPYPKAPAETFTLHDGQRIFVWPPRPADARGLQRYEGRRAGNAGDGHCKPGWSPDHSKNNTN